MKIILKTTIIILLIGCSNPQKKVVQAETKEEINIVKETANVIHQNTNPFEKTKIENKLKYDENLVSKYTIIDKEIDFAKAMVKSLSSYTTQELKNLPDSKRVTMQVTVPSDISKDGLSNTLKCIAFKQTEKDNDIDVLIIFAYDDKRDIGSGYTYGKLSWSPIGFLVSPKVASNNLRYNYETVIDIKNHVGNIKKSDVPTERELLIYHEIMSEKYWDMQEEDMIPLVMKKFNITEKELRNIHLKVGVLKF